MSFTPLKNLAPFWTEVSCVYLWVLMEACGMSTEYIRNDEAWEQDIATWPQPAHPCKTQRPHYETRKWTGRSCKSLSNKIPYFWDSGTPTF